MGYLEGTKDDMKAGAFAGAVARLVCAPFDVMKIRYQLQLAGGRPGFDSMGQAFRFVVKEEGVMALWKGNLAATYLWVTYSMVQFALYGRLKTWGEAAVAPVQAGSRQRSRQAVGPLAPPSLPHSTQSTTSSSSSRRSTSSSSSSSSSTSSEAGTVGVWKTLVLFLAGAGAGVIATSATYPLDIMRTQFAIQGRERVHNSLADFVSHTYRKEGLRGFYAGLPAGVLGVAPYIGLNFALYDSMKAVTPLLYERMGVHEDVPRHQSVGMKTIIDGVVGGVAGGISKLMVYPLDTVKRRLQFQVLQATVGPGESALRAVQGTAVKVASRVSPRFAGVGDCARTIYRVEGVAGFFRGIAPSLLKSVTATGVTFAAFEVAKDFLLWQRKHGAGYDNECAQNHSS